MAKNRNTPALFEVFGRTPTAPTQPHRIEVPPQPSPPRVHVESIAPDSPATVSAPVSPRIIRLPVGYVYVGLAVVVLLIVGSYFVGVSRGRQQALAPVEADGSERPQISDPTLDSPPQVLQGNQRPLGDTGSSKAAGGGNPAGSTPPPGPGGRTLDRDTRQAGLNYIIVERFEPDEAWAVKEFLKRNGIDVLILRDNNPALLQVVTAEGFRGWSTNTAAQALDRKLEQLGREWKARGNGTKDFSQRLAKRQE